MSETATLDVNRIGRFELKRILGKGAQATVWLAHDPRLERDVAVKLMHPAAANDAESVAQWMQEARSVSRLTHPNIVPVFEAEMHQQQPYLVFEFVPGKTLADVLRQRGGLPAREAVQTMLGVLDALQAAHDAGVVHRDLQPSNILVGEQGRARVMDFGIAARMQDKSNGALEQIVGTPGYMSPEAARGQAPAVVMDVFSAGMVLVEMLSGRRLVAERDPYRAIHRVINEDFALPPDLPAAVDDGLRASLARAIERNAGRRWPRASDFRDALQNWLTPAASVEAQAAGQSGTLEFLLRRMRHKSDFPALSDSLARIQRVTNSESESVGNLSNEILKDVALTNKLLRMVNSANYSHAGGGSISTVSRAVNLVGFAGIRNMAMSLVLLDHMHNKGHARQLKEEFLRALMAGSLADELCKVGRDGEEAFIGAMFQNLGRLLTEFYLPEEANQVRELVAAARAASPGSDSAAEATVSVRVLGLSFEELGVGVATAWGLPENLRRCMKPNTGEPPAKLAEKSQDRVRWLALAANEMTDAMLRHGADAAQARIEAIGQRYGRAVGREAREFTAAATAARRRLAEMAKSMNLHVEADSPARRLIAVVDVNTVTPQEAALAAHALQATIVSAPEAPQAVEAVNAAEILAAGVQDITNSMVEDFRLNEVLRMILETILRALQFRRVLFCLRDPKTDTLTGRFGLGEDAQAHCASLKIPLKASGDLFAVVCNKGADTLISDATVPTMSARLPAWYRAGINAPAFLLLPLQMKNAPFGLIYADKGAAGGIALGEKELSLLRTLRNQAVMAFKQSA
jgi:eukaryotic-like serine/threonine-protein kinase